jgi:hypothetical protein
VIAQPACVQVALNAEKESWAVRATSTFPAPDLTRATLPTAASGEPASIVTRIVAPATVPLIVGSEAALPPPGDVGLLPPQLCRTAPRAPPSAATAAAEHVRVQNCLRVCGSGSIA